MLHIAIHAKLATYIGNGQHDHSTFIYLSSKCMQLIKPKNQHHAWFGDSKSLQFDM
jgi:hypothetical protein